MASIENVPRIENDRQVAEGGFYDGALTDQNYMLIYALLGPRCSIIPHHGLRNLSAKLRSAILFICMYHEFKS
jgi:hypothetical protein